MPDEEFKLIALLSVLFSPLLIDAHKLSTFSCVTKNSRRFHHQRRLNTTRGWR